MQGNDHVAGIDKGREPWISDEGGRGQVTLLREKEKFRAYYLVYCLAVNMFVQKGRRRLTLGERVKYQCLYEHVSLKQLFDPSGRINMVEFS